MRLLRQCLFGCGLTAITLVSNLRAETPINPVPRAAKSTIDPHLGFRPGTGGLGRREPMRSRSGEGMLTVQSQR